MRSVVFIPEWVLASTAHCDLFNFKAEHIDTSEYSVIQVSDRIYVRGIFLSTLIINCSFLGHQKMFI
jgi:hypothetical protein